MAVRPYLTLPPGGPAPWAVRQWCLQFRMLIVGSARRSQSPTNFANRLNEAARGSHNARDMTAWGENHGGRSGSPDPERIATQADFGRELTARSRRTEDPRGREGVGTAGQHRGRLFLRTPPADGSQQLLRILECAARPTPGGSRDGRPRCSAPGGRRAEARRTTRPTGAWPGSSRGRALVLRSGGRHGPARLPRGRVLDAAAGPRRAVGRRQVVAAARGPAAPPGRPGGWSSCRRPAPVAALKAALAELATARATPGGPRSSWTSSRPSSPSARTRRSAASSSPCCASWPGPRLASWRCGPTSTTTRSATRAGRALQYRQVVLGPMSAAQVRRVITEPARLAQVDVEEGPRQPPARRPGPAGRRPRTPRTPRYEPGALPLLSHAMLATWENSRRRHPHGRRLPGQRPDQGRGHPDRRGRVRRLDRRPSSSWPAACSCGWCTSATTRRPPARRSRSASCAVGRRRGRRPGARPLRRRADDHRRRGDRADHPRRADHRLAPAAILDRRRAAGCAPAGGSPMRARAWEAAGRESAGLWRGSQLAIASDYAADAGQPRLASERWPREFVDASTAAERPAGPPIAGARGGCRRLVAVLTVLVVIVGADRRTRSASGRRRRPPATTPTRGRSPSWPASSAARTRRWPPSSAWPRYGMARTPQATAACWSPAAPRPPRGSWTPRASCSGRRSARTAAARRGRRGRDAEAVERGHARAPVAGRRTAGAAAPATPAVRGGVQP